MPSRHMKNPPSLAEHSSRPHVSPIGFGDSPLPILSSRRKRVSIVFHPTTPPHGVWNDAPHRLYVCERSPIRRHVERNRSCYHARAGVDRGWGVDRGGDRSSVGRQRSARTESDTDQGPTGSGRQTIRHFGLQPWLPRCSSPDVPFGSRRRESTGWGGFDGVSLSLFGSASAVRNRSICWIRR